MLKFIYKSWRVLFEITNQIFRRKDRRGEDRFFGVNAANLICFGIQINYINARFVRNNFERNGFDADFVFDFIGEKIDESAVAFGKCDEGLRFFAGFSDARTEIKKSCPRGSLI